MAAEKKLDLDRDNLFFAAPWLSLQNRRELDLTVPVTIYVQDPHVATVRRRLGLETIHVSRERNLGHGPTSARIAVVDYDGDEHRWYDDEIAKWHNRKRRFVYYEGRSPVEIGADHTHKREFRQLNVWAVIQRILDFFESPMGLGRPIPWAFDGNRLIVVPSAGYRENAFYDRQSKSLQFYYFGTGDDRVYTCLSHDIVAHETGHAVLDGIRPRYLLNSSIQTAAFHEFAADLTAILSAMRNNVVRQVIADTTDGDLAQPTVISDLAEQFGKAMDIDSKTHDPGSRYFLRSALNDLKMTDIADELSPHRCSNVLTGAVFDILTQIVAKQMAQNEPGKRRKVSPRTALWRGTLAITRIALQAMDYLPPVDVQFIDYARALLAAHRQADPLDRKGYGQIIQDAFHGRGLEELEDPHQPETKLRLYQFEIDRVASSITSAYRFLDENRRVLCIPPDEDISVADLYATDKISEGFDKTPREIVIEYVWSEEVELKGSEFGSLKGRRVPLLCGGTLVLDGRGNVLYWTRKPGTGEQFPLRKNSPQYRWDERDRGEERSRLLLEYVKRLVEAGQVGLVDDQGAGIDVLSPAVAARDVGGMLWLEVSPHLRHGYED